MLSSSTWFWVLNLHMSSRQNYWMNRVRGGLFLLTLLPHFWKKVNTAYGRIQTEWIWIATGTRSGTWAPRILQIKRMVSVPSASCLASNHIESLSERKQSSVKVRAIKRFSWEDLRSDVFSFLIFDFFAVCVSPTFRTNHTLSWDSPSVQHVFSKRGEFFVTNLGGLSSVPSVPSVPGLRRKWSEIWSAIFSLRPSFQCLALYKGVVGRVLQRCAFTFLFRIISYKSDSVEHEAPRWKRSPF